MSPKTVYGMIGAGTTVGWLWLWLHHVLPLKAATLPVCIFRAVTGLPCPSCGITHSVLHIGQLHWSSAFYANPLGYVAAIALLVAPVWLLYDWANKQYTLYQTYNKAIQLLRQKALAIPLILLVIINWAWNICKYYP